MTSLPTHLRIVCLLLPLLTLAANFADAGQPFSAAEKQATVDRHNEIRREPGASDMHYIDWDEGLASQAQSLADRCVFEHGNEGVSVGEFANIGENIFTVTGDSSDVKTGVEAVDEWYKEKANYNWADNSCSDECGHYTQVAWAKSRRVGCGRNHCPNLEGAFENAWFIVCTYGPAGNVNDDKPWQEGEPCTKCDTGSGQCFDGLCRPCSEHSEECVCNLECQNCGELDNECRCSCANGFTGADCSEACEDTHEMCGANPGWPNADSCDLSELVPIGCPLMCGVCNAPDEDFVCDPSQSGGTGSGGSGGSGTGGGDGSGTGGSGGRGTGGGEQGGICSRTFTAATYIDDMLYLFNDGKLWKVSSSGELQSPAGGEDATESFIRLPIDISAVYQRGDGNVVFLRDKKMYIFQDRKRIEGHPIMIDEWGVESHIAGAAFNSVRDKSYFFKGPQVWRYDEGTKSIDNGYPKSIADEFNDDVNKPNMVFSDSGGNFFFVKNSKVFRISNGRKRVDTGYPKPFAPEFFSDCRRT